MRAMWKGAISFGLVTIPVKLYAATEAKDLHFKQLHKQCGTPIRYKKFCPTCEVDVDAAQIVKGYEIERESFVTVEEEELEAIPVAASRALEIVDFIELSEIDPVFYEKTYYLEPGDGGSKPYALLRRAMEETGRIAVAKVVMRSKESLAAIRVFKEGVLALETMHFPDEVRSPAGLKGIVEPELRPQELEMAKSLVLSLSAPFEPGKYQNEYRDAVLQLISAKAHGAAPAPEAAEPKAGRVVDLMEALRASIQVAEAERGVAVAAPIPEIIIPGQEGRVAAGAVEEPTAPEVLVPAVAAPEPQVPAAAAPTAPEVVAPAVAAPRAPQVMPPAVAAPAASAPPAPPLYVAAATATPPAAQPTAGMAASAAAPPGRRPSTPLNLPGGRRPVPAMTRRNIPPGALGQSVWQYRPEL